jgi:hypothetical protein
MEILEKPSSGDAGRKEAIHFFTSAFLRLPDR